MTTDYDFEIRVITQWGVLTTVPFNWYRWHKRYRWHEYLKLNAYKTTDLFNCSFSNYKRSKIVFTIAMPYLSHNLQRKRKPVPYRRGKHSLIIK